MNRLVETVHMRGHNIWFNAELIKVIPNYHQILLLSGVLSKIIKICFMMLLYGKMLKHKEFIELAEDFGAKVDK